MVWCSQCAAEVEVEADDSHGFSCCVQCGRVVEDTAFSSDVMFAKGGDGEGELVGQMVGASGEARGIGRYSGGRMWGSGGDGHEAAVSRGRYEICSLVEALRISPSSEATEAAHRLYRLALQRGFTKGRRVNQVAAVCLYIFCRLERRPYMLIDFSDHLSVNVYALGAVFLNMLRLLRLDEHATFTKPIDPSLFMNRFVDRLRLPTPELKTKVGNTAMRLVQSMKRDWMLTGRRPNGICGAALFLASHIHGVEKTKKDVISIVHIGWSTVEKRVMELAETRDAELTLRELDEREKAMEQQRDQMLLDYERTAIENAAANPPMPVVVADEGGEEAGADGAALATVDPNAAGKFCEHVRAGSPLLAHGMCRLCLEEYLKITIAVQEGANDPPAYLRNLRKDIRKRVRAKLASERPVLLLRDSSEVLALEGPDDGDELDIHQRRHLENEAALEEPGADVAADGAGPSAAPAAAAPAAGAGGKSGGGAAVDEEEEEDFDEALHSSDLQPLARALGGVVAAVATAPMQARKVRAEPVAPEPVAAAAAVAVASGTATAAAPAEAAAGAGAAEAWDADADNETVPPADKSGAAASSSREAAGSGDGGDAEPDEARRAKRARMDVSEAEAALAAAGEGGDDAAAIALAAGVVDGQLADAAEAGDADKADSDNLSDVDEDDINGYLATNEEANVREQLWVEMNKDWIEKQEAKKAAEALAAADNKSDKGKRKYTRKPKAEVAAAEDAAGSTRNLLAAKKLSNKINYGALADLFGGADGAGPSGSAQRRSASPDYDAGGGANGGGYGGRAAAAMVADVADEAPRPAVAAALAKRAVDRARTQAADADKYASALEDEQRRRGGGGLGGGGGFLDSLTFARGNGDGGGAGGRSRPQGLSLKSRGR